MWKGCRGENRLLMAVTMSNWGTLPACGDDPILRVISAYQVDRLGDPDGSQVEPPRAGPRSGSYLPPALLAVC